MQYLSVILPVAAFVSGAVAAPNWGGDSGADACLAAVTGSAALGDYNLRASHCKSYLATTVTPISTETVYITGNANDNWKRSTVAYCPNEVPNYASACDDAHYTSACSKFGFTDVITTTVAPTTTTKTIWVKPTGGAGGDCTSTVTKAGATSTVTTTTTVGADKTATYTVTSTETKTSTVGGGSTVTSTVTSTTTVKEGGNGGYSATTVTVTSTDTKTCSSTSATPSSCNVDDDLASKLVNNFAILLEQTSGPGGSGYNQAVSDATLATDFVDISDSINFMSGVNLGAVSFSSKSQFDQGQGSQPEVTLDVLNIWHDCDSVTWRWRISSTQFPVTGISHFTVNDDKLIQKNWVEFDNGAWLQSYGQNCSFIPGGPQVSTPPASKRAFLAI